MMNDRNNGLTLYLNHPILMKLKDKFLEPIGLIIIKLKITPTAINLFGLALGIMSGVLVGAQMLNIGGILLLISFVADGLDGFVARKTATENTFGSFFDGVCDRYVDTVVLLGLSWYLSVTSQFILLLLVFVSIVGSVVTSYSTPHALSLSNSLKKAHIGVFGRAPRTLAMVTILIFPQLMVFGIWGVAILTNITALQRVVYYSRYFLKND